MRNAWRRGGYGPHRGDPGDGRSSRPAPRDRCATGAHRGVALFRRPLGGGDRRGSGDLAAHREARLGDGQGVAARRTGRPEIAMTPERWARIKEIFTEASERQAAERSAFLDSACGGDERLRAEVERLLVQDGESLKSPAGDLLPLAANLAAPQWSPGTLVGPYRIDQIGRASCRERV